MKQQYAPVCGRLTLERGCALAERRLDYLTELFESGRWRRFHSEADFLDNIREAKSAVDTWRRLSRGVATIDNTAIDRSRSERPSGVPLQPVGQVLHEEPRWRTPQSIRHAAETAATGRTATEMFLQQMPRDPPVMQDRYPILRNAM